MMKISQSQIQDLYKFTRQHFVEHYDVQTELVDHLANDIEQIWLEYPDLSYEEAKQKSFKKFGVFGFMDVVEQRQKTMSKRYMKIFWRYAKEWFSIPKIILTLMLFSVFHFLLQVQLGKYIFFSLLVLLTIAELVIVFRLKRKYNKRFNENNRKWMLEEMIFSVASFNTILLGSNLFSLFNHVTSKTLSFSFALVISGCFVLALIYSYVTLKVLPEKVEELLEETYPEYKIV